MALLLQVDGRGERCGYGAPPAESCRECPSTDKGSPARWARDARSPSLRHRGAPERRRATPRLASGSGSSGSAILSRLMSGFGAIEPSRVAFLSAYCCHRCGHRPYPCCRNQAYATKLAVEAVEALNASTGGYGLLLSNPVQRAWRDVNAVARHVSLNWDAVGTMYGQHAFGLEPRGQY